jgi:hypothetical protein
VFEDDVPYVAVIAGHFVDVDLVLDPTEPDVDRRYSRRARQLVKHVIRGRDHSRLPALLRQRDRQVVNDVCYAPDLAARESAILGCREYNVSGADGNLPSA